MTVKEFTESCNNVEMEFIIMNRRGSFDIVNDYIEKHPEQKPISVGGWDKLMERFFPMDVSGWKVVPELNHYVIEVRVRNIE